MRTSSWGLSGIICRRLGNDLCIRLIEKFEDFDGKSCEALIIIAPEHRIAKKRVRGTEKMSREAMRVGGDGKRNRKINN